MIILVLLILVSVTIAIGFLGLFIWAVKSGQFDDTSTPAIRMLFENKKRKEEEHKKSD